MPEDDGIEVEVDYLDLSDDTIIAEMQAARDKAQDVKILALAKLGIVPKEGEAPLTAWCRAMHEKNGLPYSQPAHPAIRELFEWNRPVQRWVWFLA